MLKIKALYFYPNLALRPGSQHIKRLLLIKENHISQGIYCFSVYGEMQSLDSLEFFL